MKKFFKSFLSFNPVSISTLIILIVCIMLSHGIVILNLFELKTYDQRLKWRGVKKPPPVVVAAAIDEKSLDREGMWPWPRRKIADLVNMLSDDGAKVIGLDVFFTEPDKSINLDIINRVEKKLGESNIKDRGIDEYLKKEKQKADNDVILANAFKNSKAKIVLPYFWHGDKKESRP